MKAFETLNVSYEVVALNSQIYSKNNGLECCNKATICVENGNIRYRVDGGEPTSTVGLIANAGDVITLEGRSELKFFRAVLDAASAADADLSIDYGVNNHE